MVQKSLHVEIRRKPEKGGHRPLFMTGSELSPLTPCAGSPLMSACLSVCGFLPCLLFACQLSLKLHAQSGEKNN